MPIERHRVPQGEGWASLIDTWGHLLDKYEKVSNPDYDVAYWHGENALTASLASAAWQNGGAGLVEFDTKRQCLNPAESGGGRGDAWLRVGDRWYTVEAKLCWSDTVKNCLEDARTQLSMLPKEDRANVGLILCYCVPEFPPDAPHGTFAALAAVWNGGSRTRSFSRPTDLLRKCPRGTLTRCTQAWLSSGKSCPGMPGAQP